MPNLEELNLSKCKVLSIADLDKKCPNLSLLDLSENDIFKVEAIETLKKL